ncbi:MAG TPA: DUF6541 family protein [Chloroflexia bacterium]|nr:DUF6541 family protein [Chloroflexia bacterium]
MTDPTLTQTPLPARPSRANPQTPAPASKPSPRAVSGWRGLLAGPPPYVRLLLMAAPAVALLAVIVAGLISLSRGIELRSFEQHISDASTDTLSTSLLAQSFHSPRANFNRIELQLSSFLSLPDGGRVRLLAGDGLDGQPVYEAPLSAAKFENPFLTINFPAIAASENVTYTLALETPGRTLSSVLGLRYNSEDALTGTLYTDGDSLDGDLALAASYHYDLWTLWGDIAGALSSDWLLIVSWALLLLLPGLALLAWLPNSLSAGQRFLAAPGLTVLMLPVLFLVTRAVGLRVGALALWVLLALCAGALGLWLVRHKPRVRLRGIKPGDFAFWGLLSGVFTATLVTRLVSLRDAFAGLGLDAYHHTLIPEMFIRAGGIPSGYEPYAPLASFTYHYGFHALIATIGWLSGRTEAADVMLLMPQVGQFASALPVLTLTLFGWKVMGNRWAGLAAGALAGLVSIFPAFYVNWSRYTQGLGLALLPVAWVLLLEVLERRRQAQPSESTSIQASPPPAQPGRQITWQSALQQSGPYMLAVLASAGLALTHYRIAMIYGGFVGLYLVWRALGAFRTRTRMTQMLQLLQRVAVVSALTLATLLPWLLNLTQNFTRRFVGRETEASVGYYSLDRTLGGTDLVFHQSLLFMLALSVIGVAVSIWRRNPYPTILALTWLLLGLWSNPYLLPFRLPYAGYLDVTTLLTGAWVALALLAGYALGEMARGFLSLADTYKSGRQRLWRMAAFTLMGGAILVGGMAVSLNNSARLDNKPYIARADAEALAWARDNLPRDSYVLANPFAFPWSNAVQGSDSGLWVPLAAPGARASVPPLPAYNERPEEQGYLNDLLEITHATGYQSSGPMQPDWDALKSAGITHVYVGSRGGALTVPVLLRSDRTDLIFHRDAVWIFRLR